MAKSNRVCDFPVSFESGLWNCCADEVENNKDIAVKGQEITCQDCGQTMILSDEGGIMMWRLKQ